MSEAGSPHDFVYVHTDIPEAMTIRQWRGRNAAQRLTAGAATRADRHQRRAPRTRRRPAALRMPLRRLRPRGRVAHG